MAQVHDASSEAVRVGKGDHGEPQDSVKLNEQQAVDSRGRGVALTVTPTFTQRLLAALKRLDYIPTRCRWNPDQPPAFNWGMCLLFACVSSPLLPPPASYLQVCISTSNMTSGCFFHSWQLVL